MLEKEVVFLVVTSLRSIKKLLVVKVYEEINSSSLLCSSKVGVEVSVYVQINVGDNEED